MSTYYRYGGRYTEAERELNRAVSLARERNLEFGAVITAIRLAQLRLDTGDYEGARRLLLDALPKASARAQLEAQLYLARAEIRLGESMAARPRLDAVAAAIGESGDSGLRPPLYTVLGEWAYEAGRSDEARQSFEQAAALLTDELPDADAVEASAYSGLLEARRGEEARGRARVAASIEIARRIGHLSLQARGRVFLAEIEASRGRFAAALEQLAQVPADSDSGTIERELRARVSYWSALAKQGSGAPGAAADAAAAEKVIQAIADRLEPARRPAFFARATVREALMRDVR
jgi:predicted negative regulator of RcsB-dependent stress response